MPGRNNPCPNTMIYYHDIPNYLSGRVYRRLQVIRFWTGFVWPDAEDLNDEVLLLQQVRYGKQSIVLTVIGNETGRTDPVRELKDWFQREGLLLCRRAKEEWSERRITQTLKAFACEKANLTGILMAEDRFWLIPGQCGSLYLFNRRFLRTHIRQLTVTGVVNGSMEKGIGILIGSKGFCEGISMDCMKQCLAVQEIAREAQIESRLKELAEEGYRRCGKRGCAIYVKTV